MSTTLKCKHGFELLLWSKIWFFSSSPLHISEIYVHTIYCAKFYVNFNGESDYLNYIYFFRVRLPVITQFKTGRDTGLRVGSSWTERKWLRSLNTTKTNVATFLFIRRVARFICLTLNDSIDFGPLRKPDCTSIRLHPNLIWKHEDHVNFFLG